MQPKQITIPLLSASYQELPADDRRLIDAAKKATEGAHAPYSNFHVGAALLLDDGTIVTGANQENAAFSSGTCAERSAIFWAGANHPGEKIIALAIAAEKGGAFQDTPISPCGACRQALLEYENNQASPIRLLLYGQDEVLILPSIASTLPLCFTEF